MQCSFILPSFNRRQVLLRTLDELGRCGLPAEEFEIFVVDNASSDGAAQAVAHRFPHVRLLALSQNLGPCARNMALPHCRGNLIMFLDDDSWPLGDSMSRLGQIFADNPTLAAAVFRVVLPDGTQECSAYPDVFIGCGTAFRRQALLETGGLPDDFFMQAEEYDLSLRLLDRGWRIVRFPQLSVRHLKTPMARFSRRLTRLDVRNNILLAHRYFPPSHRQLLLREWLLRYYRMAQVKGHFPAFYTGLAQGFAKCVSEPPNRPVNHSAFEQFAKFEQTQKLFAQAAARWGWRRVALLDWGKNIAAYRLAAQCAGVRVGMVIDQFLGGEGVFYRGIPVLTDAMARPLCTRSNVDAVIVANLSPVHAEARADQWRNFTPLPVLWLERQ